MNFLYIFRCTRPGHTPDRCKSKDKVCRNCNNVGHFVEVSFIFSLDSDSSSWIHPDENFPKFFYPFQFCIYVSILVWLKDFSSYLFNGCLLVYFRLVGVAPARAIQQHLFPTVFFCESCHSRSISSSLKKIDIHLDFF